MQTPLIAFLSGTGRDSAGRLLYDVLQMSDDALERHHDYIQWLFPLPEPSQAVPGSPVLSAAEMHGICGSAQIRKNLLAATARMKTFLEDNDHWLTAFDHNHLRITRVIRSLSLLVGEEEAASFLHAVTSLNELAANPVNTRTLEFWREAAKST